MIFLGKKTFEQKVLDTWRGSTWEEGFEKKARWKDES